MTNHKYTLYISLIGFLAFSLATFLYISNLEIDSFAYQIALSLQGGILDIPIRLLSLLGTPPALLVVSVAITLILLRYKMKIELLYYWIAIVSNALATSAIKEIVSRDRPYSRMENISSYSFPSWHASTAMALSIAIILILASRDDKYRWWILSWGFAVGCSRVYLNVHWCSDVLAGWGLGAFISATAGYLILVKNR